MEKCPQNTNTLGRISHSSTNDILGQVILCSEWGCPMCSGMFSSIPGLHPLDASDNQKYFQMFPNVLLWINCLQLRTRHNWNMISLKNKTQRDQIKEDFTSTFCFIPLSLPLSDYTTIICIHTSDTSPMSSSRESSRTNSWQSSPV